MDTFCSEDRIPAASMAFDAESEQNLIRVGAIPAIDLRFLSEEDLNCLATLSDELRHVRREDVVVPKIDRSVFNESAGSRRQTYSRLRLAQRKDEAVAVRGGRRRTGLLTVSRQPAGSVDNSGNRDNDLIVSLLRELFSKENPASSEVKNGFLPRVSSPVEGMGARSIGTVGLLEDLASRPRKRRKKDDARRKMQGSSQGVRDVRAFNVVSSSSTGAQNGVLNVLPLASEDIFIAELKRRTAGLASEADVLGFLGGLPGRWASRRKKKKFVEASDVGQGLPKGWKILVGIRRKHGRVYVDCRKYISPSGKQFISYKEVYSHLMSSVGSHSASQDVSPNLGVDNSSVNKFSPGKSAGVKEDSQKDNSQPQMVDVGLVSATLSASSDNDGPAFSYKVKNPVKDQFRSLLECRQCKVSFCKKEEFMQHLLTSHQRNAKTCRPCKTIGEGVIIKDGKYECQICHKIFEERHRYNGHVGVHVRHYVRSLEALPDEIIVEKNVDQSSHVGVTSIGCSAIGSDSNSLIDGSDVKTNGQQTVTCGSSVSNAEMCEDQNASDSIPRDATSEMVSCAALTDVVDGQNNDAAIAYREEEKVGSVQNPNAFSNEEDDIANSCLPSNQNGTSDSVNPSLLDRKDKGSNNSANSFCGFHKDLANNSGGDGQKCKVNDETSKCSNSLDGGVDVFYGDKEKDFRPSVAESAVLVDEKSEKQFKLTDSSSVSLQSSSCLLSHEMKIEKGEDELKIAGQTNERRSGSEKVPVGDSKQPISISLDLDCGVALVEATGTSVQPDWDALLPKIINNHQVTTVCVWCRKEFNHEGIDPETQSDSVGFMCPACKAKISGKLNVLDDGLVKNFDPL